MGPESSLTHSQQPATCSYPEPYKSSPHVPISLLEEHTISSRWNVK